MYDFFAMEETLQPDIQCHSETDNKAQLTEI